MRVAILGPSKSIHTHKWALYFKQQGYEVKVFTFGNHFSQQNANEIETVCITSQNGSKLSYFKAIPFLKNYLVKWKPTILHAHFATSYGLIGSLVSYKPFFVSVWGSDVFEFPKKSRVHKGLIEFVFRRADVICSTSHIMARETELYTNKKIYVTPFGVDTTEFSLNQNERSSNIFHIGILKGLRDIYGIDDLLHAFSLVNRQYPASKLLIAGEGPEKARLEKLILELELSHSVELLGHVHHSHIPPLIQSLDVVVLPSKVNESFGVGAIEAMACGKPVIVSNMGGLPEVVDDKLTGYIIPKENPKILSEKLIYLLENPEISSQMGINGREKVLAHYDWNENAKYMKSIYLNYLKGDL